MDHLIVFIMFGHWVADFLCQSRWMAENKSEKFVALFTHGAVYTLVLTYLMLITTMHVGEQQELYKVLLFCIMNGVCHLGVDGVTSRITKYCWNKGRTHWFFMVIGLDQFIHFAILFETMRLCL